MSYEVDQVDRVMVAAMDTVYALKIRGDGGETHWLTVTENQVRRIRDVLREGK